MKLSRSSVLILGAWVFFVGGYTAASLLLPHGSRLTTFSDLTEAFVALFANTCLLWNAASPYRRRNAFWMLLAFGCTLWLAGQLFWTYQELVLHRQMQSPFPGDLLFFVHTVPFMAALALMPHARKMRDSSLRLSRPPAPRDRLALSLYFRRHAVEDDLARPGALSSARP